MLILNQILWTIQLGQIFYNEETQAGHRPKLATPVCVCVCVWGSICVLLARLLETKFVVPGTSAFRSGQAQRREITKFPIWFSGCVCRPFGSPCSKPKGKHLSWVGVCVWCVFVFVMAGKRFAYFCDTGATLNWIPYSNSREISVSILSNYRWPCPQTNRINRIT